MIDFLLGALLFAVLILIVLLGIGLVILLYEEISCSVLASDLQDWWAERQEKRKEEK